MITGRKITKLLVIISVYAKKPVALGFFYGLKIFLASKSLANIYN